MMANPNQPSVDAASWGLWNSSNTFSGFGGSDLASNLGALGFDYKTTTASSAASATTAADSSASRNDITATTAPSTTAPGNGNAGAIGSGKNGNGDSAQMHPNVTSASKWNDMADLWGSTNTSSIFSNIKRSLFLVHIIIE